MTDNEEKKTGLAAVSWGPWVAMAAAVILTAKGEFDLAVLAHFVPSIAWMFPVMIDVYVITAFHRGRRRDMVISMLLMIFCQVAVHVLPVYITEGEKTPWGLVVAVACIAPVVVVRVKILIGRTTQEIAAEQEAARRADEVRAARAETTAARAAQAQAQAAARAETARAEAEIAAAEQRVQAEISAREAAEIRATEAETRAEIAEQQQAEIAARAEQVQAEISARAEAEIAREKQALTEALETSRRAQDRAVQHAQAAAAAEGRLAEAREIAERAAAARVHAEQAAAAQIERVTTGAEQDRQGLRRALAEAQETGRRAQATAATLADDLRTVQAQRDEARAAAERQANRAARAEQSIEAAEQTRDAALNDLEAARRRLARVTEQAGTVARARAEISSPAKAEISARPERKSALPVPVRLPENLPVVETVRPEKVATVLVAKAMHPQATIGELAEFTDISDRTIGKVLRGVPAEIAAEVVEQIFALAGGGQVLALTDGRAA